MAVFMSRVFERPEPYVWEKYAIETLDYVEYAAGSTIQSGGKSRAWDGSVPVSVTMEATWALNLSSDNSTQTTTRVYGKGESAAFVFTPFTTEDSPYSWNADVYMLYSNTTLTCTTTYSILNSGYTQIMFKLTANKAVQRTDQTQKVKGDLIDTVSSTSSGDYPDNGIQGSYWYVRIK